MREPITVGGHLRIRPFNTAESYPEQRLDNDLCQAVVAGDTIYLRGQVPQAASYVQRALRPAQT
jgi:hypothetical protein